MADPVMLAQLDALDAEIALLKVRAESLRHCVMSREEQVPPTAVVSLPERCQTVPARQCALQDDEARRSLGSFAHPQAWQCAGCRFREMGQDVM